jgi:hypothetical protein
LLQDVGTEGMQFYPPVALTISSCHQVQTRLFGPVSLCPSQC